jgi:hypothetical protein
VVIEEINICGVALLTAAKIRSKLWILIVVSLSRDIFPKPISIWEKWRDEPCDPE